MLINYKRKEKTKELDEYKCTVSKKTLRYGKESRRLAKNYKVLKYAFFNSPRRYDKIHGCIKQSVFADISKDALPKIRIIRICHRTINIINCTHEGVSLVTKQEAVKKKCVLVLTSRPHEQHGP